MSLKNALDPDTTVRQLQDAIAAHVPGARDVRVDRLQIPQTSGLSNQTILFDAQWFPDATQPRALVARLAPTDPAVFAFPRYDIELQARVIAALAERTAVPVPRILFATEQPNALGAPCIVMDRIEGRVPADDPPFTTSGWVLELSALQRRRLMVNALAALAGLHTVDPAAIGLSTLVVRPDAGLDGQIAFYRNYFEWAAGGQPNPTVEAGFVWLEQHRPADPGASVITWGDARLGNMMFGDNQSVRALLDWEMVTYAPAGIDVGWMLLMNRWLSEGIGVCLPEGIPAGDEALAIYAECGGTRVADLPFWETFAALRLSILMHRLGRLMIHHGLSAPDSTMSINNPGTQLLASLAGLTPPAGNVENFVGQR
jgi:aminoglycoside phosphotransferase (APT) family kinase protein